MLDNQMTGHIPVMLILIAIIACAVVFLSIKSKNRADQRIIDAFGKIPECEGNDLGPLKAYHRYALTEERNHPLIDNLTWNDLNMDAVFQRINVCVSSVGEEYLYYILHDLQTCKSKLENRERLLQWLEDNPDARLKLQKILHGIGKSKGNGLSSYLFRAEAKKLKNSWVYPIMALLPIVGLALFPLFPGVGATLGISAACINSVIYHRTSIFLESDLESVRYFSALLYGAKSINKKFDSMLGSIGFGLKEALKPYKRIGGLLPGKSQQLMSEMETFFLLFKTIFLVDLLRYNRTVDVMIKHSRELNEMYKIVGEIDAAICILSYRHSLEYYCLPKFHDSNTVNFAEVFHPLLNKPVANSGRIGNDSIITGSNASGKSTFIKTIAINHILAQTIYTCCAKRYELGFSYVVSSMAVRDDILAGESYFVAEVKSLKRVIEYCSTRRCVCFIDEILRGTNTPERIAASTAILKMLHETESLCMVASHDIELTEILADIYDNYHFSETFENDLIEFDYLLKIGPSQSTNAVKLLKYMGFEKRIVDEATALLDNRNKGN